MGDRNSATDEKGDDGMIDEGREGGEQKNDRCEAKRRSKREGQGERM